MLTSAAVCLRHMYNSPSSSFRSGGCTNLPTAVHISKDCLPQVDITNLKERHAMPNKTPKPDLRLMLPLQRRILHPHTHTTLIPTLLPSTE